MIDIDSLYFEWLLTRLDPGGVSEALEYVCELLHDCDFMRRVGNDMNRAADGANLRKEFLTDFDEADFDPHVTNDLMMLECSWFEMLVALARTLDYLYDGGVEGRFIELITNMGLDSLIVFRHDRSEEMQDLDQKQVCDAANVVDQNQFDRDGRGGLFPLVKPDHPDQREVELWDQAAAYFREKLEGVYF